MTLSILLLICSTSISPADCTRDTAVVVMRGPEVRSEAGCGLSGQTFLAATSLRLRLTSGEFLKVVCERKKETQDG